MTFKQIVNGSLSYKFLLIEDSPTEQTNILLAAIVKEGISYGKEVHLCCFNNSPANIEQNLRVQRCEKLHTHDFFSDSAGWLKDSGYERHRNIFSSVQKLCSESSGVLIIIDSLSSFIMLHGLQDVYRQIHQLIHFDTSTKGDFSKQLVGVLSPDTLVNYEATLSQLRHLTTSWATVPTKRTNQRTVIIKIVHRKANGKMVEQIEECWLDSQGLLQSKKIDISRESVSRSDNELPSQLTTFNLGLKEEEKAARSQLVLPYLKTESEKAGGSIYYEPDENDDWDEEDPDDDLDI